MNPTNLQIANWLDPEHKRDGWWTSTRPDYELGGDNTAYFAASGEVKYTGPDFYTHAVCAEEVEPALEAIGYWWKRSPQIWGKYLTQVFLHVANINSNTPIVNHHHHPTACILALAKIKEADHA